MALHEKLFSVGELLRLNQLEPDRAALNHPQRELFGEIAG